MAGLDLETPGPLSPPSFFFCSHSFLLCQIHLRCDRSLTVFPIQPKRASHVSTSSSYSPAAAKAQIGKGSGAIVAPVHLLIIADTQVLDAHSWPSIPHLIRPLITFAVELNTRKNWRTTVGALNPHAVLFLGDMINGGRYAHSQEE